MRVDVDVRRPEAPSSTSEVAAVVALVAARRHADVPARVGAERRAVAASDGSRPRSEFTTSPRRSDSVARRSLVRGPASGTTRPTAPGGGSGNAGRASRPGMVSTHVGARAPAPRLREPSVSEHRARAQGARPGETATRTRSCAPQRTCSRSPRPSRLVLLAPPGGDSAAHLYRTMLVRDGVTVWDNLWYGGQYPLASYSLLYYLPAAVVGNVPLVILAVVASAALFAAVADARVGRGRALARPCVRAARGRAALHGDVQLRRRPRRRARVPAPAAAAAALARRRGARRSRSASARSRSRSSASCSSPSLRRGARAVARPPSSPAVWRPWPRPARAPRLFPSEGRYPFSPLSLAAALTVSALGAALAWRAERGRLIAPFFVLWAVVCTGRLPRPVAVRRQPDAAAGRRVPAGAARGGARALPTALARGRRRSRSPSSTTSAPTSRRCRSAPTTRRPRARRTGSRRWTTWRRRTRPITASRSCRRSGTGRRGGCRARGIALARGWYRQIDLAENPELYSDPLDAGAYRALARPARRALGAPSRRAARADGRRPRGRAAPLGAVGSAGGAPLGPLDGLRGARRDADPRRRARLTRFEHEAIAGTVGRGRHLLRVRWNRYWQRRDRRRLPRARARRADHPRGRTGGPLLPRDRARRGALRQGRLSRRRSGRVARDAPQARLPAPAGPPAGGRRGLRRRRGGDADAGQRGAGRDRRDGHRTDTGGETETGGGTTDTGGGETSGGGGGGDPAAGKEIFASAGCARATRSRTRARPARSARTSTRRSPTPSSCRPRHERRRRDAVVQGPAQRAADRRRRGLRLQRRRRLSSLPTFPRDVEAFACDFDRTLVA